MARLDFVDRSPLARAALDFAARSHAGQTRDTGTAPFLTHPVEVACLLHEAGYSDEVVAAGVLHDVLEDTEVEREELERRFGSEVASLVAAVSDDPAIRDHAKRKAALRVQVAQAEEHAAAVFAADKISKTREMRRRMERGRFERKDRTKVEHYEASLGLLQELMPGHPLVALLREELEGLHAPPVGGA